jgi:phenylalanyl-tRNA synthetase alpha chain
VGHPRVDVIAQEARDAVAAARSAAELEQVRVRFLGRQGVLTQLLRSLGGLAPEERPLVGAAANEAKRALEALLEERLARALDAERSVKRARERLDLTLPGRRPPRGALHPLTRVHDEIVAIFAGLGFSVVEGPEIETDYYNFEALNIPRDHPARDMQDTFYISDEVVLRTHTSPVQIRVMEKQRPPIRIIVPGKVYRVDADITHSPMFQQIEGLIVDRDISLGDLKGVLEVFVQQFFGPSTKMRFRPSYFPFTEPSAEVDIQCVKCQGRGCQLCGSGWLEILGSGMVNPALYSFVGYDPEEYTGFAFGMGAERLAMLKYGIDDIRLFYENDLRFLQQF